MDDALARVRAFCDAWAAFDLDELVGFFTEDAVYHNIPVDPVAGREQIREFITGFTSGVEKIEFEVRHAVAAGDVVMTERVDHFTYPDGRAVSLPVMGVFELREGQIAAWRDYFDLNQFMSQLAG
ncbi:MAG TPA: SgcJ/EcaC family oxidoreductase [Acidimicrobiales bacterium]|nr:SgcJ/EcaC family oxidoreductase [Acidimicrobiales bacterium]